MDNNRLEMRAATDPEFRAALIADPHAVLAALGLELDPGVQVSVEESTPTELVLAIPPTLPEAVELDEHALAGVAGGITPVFGLGVTAFFGAAGTTTAALVAGTSAAVGIGAGIGLSRL